MKSEKKKINTAKALIYTALTLVSLASLFPFYWMFVMGTNTNQAINQTPPVVVPGGNMGENFQNVLNSIPFFQAMLNSLIVSSSITIGVLFLCSLAGFAFAKFIFPGRTILFIFILATMMIPPQLSLIPQYFIITELGWLSDLRAVIVPGLMNAFGIFWMRQYIASAVPDDIIESARIDGCSNFRIYWNIIVPIVLPAFATLGIIVFMAIWGDYLWPLVVLQDQSTHTIQVALASLMDGRVLDYGMVLAGTFWATVPLIIIFLLFNRLFIRSITEGAVKS
ncbi:carbohydrate ABC transporter permease [Salisediminibacterium halotolerans]|uniref:Cellobiose transport system permease protein n=1 Tax=Salisediminibacterium halotolerans TaxID=517425 RepID=A0A1H9RAG8_9BACI|nr:MULTISPECIES: carbohydrate ABC transporter permease [Salisediminibacterium]RLJ78298.1 carbohydrate ABC transporter membrane protein 2 (CUT1 family) [Actinophytocola xinjiangensis]RPE88363.1 carbohydrate ABC transporter membrane protein 2 (CUT1 family) [Salisediminibacterium halotolerans]TWG37274.1 carbohydrate ABC transporter membrane protein 2 (CUT1 family) [Salisediminibacterium halotolerans]SER69911.1 cellobiose transport system permease protein [Salisediminibacterium haloalkalitolerans]